MTECIINAYDDGSNIVVCTRDETGALKRRRHQAEYIAWLNRADGERVEDRLRRHADVARLTWAGDWLRVGFVGRHARQAACDPTLKEPGWMMRRLGVTPFESDLSPLKVWLAEADITFAKPRRAYLDIEVDARHHSINDQTEGEARTLMWAIRRDDGTVTQEILDADTDDAERELLRAFWHEIEQDDQIVAWNGDFYDFPVMFNRTVKLGMKCDPRRWIWLDHLPIFRRQNMAASESGDEKQSMALHSVAMAVLGYGKDDFDAMKGRDAWEQGEGGVDFERFAAYNAKDVSLMAAIEAATGYLAIHQEVCDTCNVAADTKGANPTHFVEGWLIKQGRARGLRYPSKWDKPEYDQFLGAYVMEPTKLGILRNVHVADFASMYPSIIISWNMSLETYTGNVGAATEVHAGYSLAPGTGATFSTATVGALPLALLTLQGMRAQHSKAKAAAAPGSAEWAAADRRATSAKTLINSVYGVVGSQSSRFYMREVAEACTQVGVWLIKETIGQVEAQGYDPIYSDTDSVYVQGCGEEAFRRFVQRLNEDVYPALVAPLGLREMQVKIAYEKEFSIIIMVGKKRYAGLFAHYKGQRALAGTKAEIKGLEVKRGDTAKLARRMQQRAIDLLLAGDATSDGMKAFVHAERDIILQTQLELADVKVSKTLKQRVRDYKGPTKADGSEGQLPMHVRAAKALMEAGVSVREGTRIGYVVVDGGGLEIKVVPEQHYTGEYDRHYLWENLVYPPTERMLAVCFPGEKWGGYGRTRRHDSQGQGRLF